MAEELQPYSPLVTSGSYLMAFDPVMDARAEVQGETVWAADNPLTAGQGFLEANPESVEDPYYNRMRVTHCPRGFLRRSPGRA